jgi:hypothetical protein
MILYFEFEDRKVNALVKWPTGDNPIEVNLTDPRMSKVFPTDLYFEIGPRNKVVYELEDKDNKRLAELQKVLSKRLQEFVNQP